MKIHEEADRCLLCIDAPCSKVCKRGDPARTIRAIRFGNEAFAGLWEEWAELAKRTKKHTWHS